ncbi:MAG: hypothetical protein DI589_23020 [Shinella sp.]|nr:MAG: hypothetical protein DI589_23020 [Shinella sp.]
MSSIRIADFSEYPAGRGMQDGPDNGTRFRDQFLVPALRTAIENNEVVYVALDDVKSFGSSFLEEAFGGLIRDRIFAAKELKRALSIKADRPIYATYKRQIERYLKDAESVGR